MKFQICSLFIPSYQQFQNLYLDFTDPETKMPYSKICFIGRNGTGKTRILEMLHEASNIKFNYTWKCVFYVQLENFKMYMFIDNGNVLYFDSQVDQISNWMEELYSKSKEVLEYVFNNRYNKENILQFGNIFEHLINLEARITSKINFLNQISVYSPAESSSNPIIKQSIPVSNLNEALKYFKTIPKDHIISTETISEFWKMLIFRIKQRENEKAKFENLPENLDKTKRQLIEEFNAKYPQILAKLAEIWDRILAPAGLEFDYEGATNPVQLTDNLTAYIRVKETHDYLSYANLSTGIRNYIFRVGHIFSLYFNEPIESAFLFIDEPENGLFPDFLYDLVDLYQEITGNKDNNQCTQIFMATHNPIIAAQFEPQERFILDFDENYKVVVRKGSSPVGDDPNDLLKNDFSISNLMGKEGMQAWNDYLQFKRKLRNAQTEEEKEKYTAKILKISQQYNF